MAKLLLIETSTALCSTAVSDGEKIICERRSDEPRQHASMTAVYIKEMLDECGLTMADIDAVALSAGPGSYTGLRVGSSTAKGLCFGAGKPLIAVGTLDVLAWQALDSFASLRMTEKGLGMTILPMIDARRMEVYTAPYTLGADGCPVRQGEVAPVVLDEHSFEDLFAAGPVAVIGDGAEKFCTLLQGTITDAQHRRGTLGAGPLIMEPKGSSAAFVECCPEAHAMLRPALKKFEAGQFENIAYFEPFYLKDFVATVGKKLF
ncbi:MAG: tRNA (adenosine(37)-N6)-threonylcarbamoyltransferase complex dimerization subunit type 1 TsaB [Bacteroidales bacterium]|nr:tRNA (adenosine(37)-N6)-threonylcarbamoyltransferase complex dimerization subunit type 1 TsaB [Bacteroidales bacterium]